MNVVRLRFQDGRVEEHPLRDGQLLIRLEPSGGLSTEGYAGGTYSASDLRSLELPAFVPAPPPKPPPMKEVEHDLTVYSADGQRVGPERRFRVHVPDWPEPAPTSPGERPKAKPRAKAKR